MPFVALFTEYVYIIPIPATLLKLSMSKTSIRSSSLAYGIYTVKKVGRFPVPRRDVNKPNSPWPGIMKIFPSIESLVSDIPAGKGKRQTFFTVYGRKLQTLCLENLQ
jgi:hypothetical protein